MKVLVADIETDGLLKECTRIWVLCVGDPETKKVTRYTDHDPAYPSVAQGIERLKAHVDAGGKVVFHNGIGFDGPAIRKLTGVWFAPWEAMLDTLVLGRLLDPQRPNGHNLASYGVELGLYKGDHSDWSCYSDSMGSYCEQDVRVGMAVWAKVQRVLDWGESPEIEHRIAYLIELQMTNGFTLDVKAATILAAELDDEVKAQTQALQEIFPPIYVPSGSLTPSVGRVDGKGAYVKGAPLTKIALQTFNPGSTHHVAARLFRKYGWKAPTTEAGNPNVDEAVLKKLDFPEAQALLKFARVNKLHTQVAGEPKKNGTGGGWLFHVGDDGRVHGYVNPNGAVTGRMTHSRPNSANIDKDARMRALWIPRSMWKLVGIDAEGLELRMLAHYLAPLDGGALTRALLEGDKSKGTDAHSMNRVNTDLHSRDGAKTLLYGSMYGAGDEKAGAIWVADWQASGKPKSEWPTWAFRGGKLRPLKSIGKVVKAKLIDGMAGYRELMEGVQAKAKKQGWIRGLDGRRIAIRSEHAALNTLLQGGGAIVMKKALIFLHHTLTVEMGLVHGKDFGYCANVHDEWQIECRPELAQVIGEAGKNAITAAGNHFNSRCRLDGAYDIGINWHETH